MKKGVSRSSRAKTYASIKPSQKTGMEMPMLAITIVMVSTMEFRLMAEMIPSSTPTVVEKIIAQKVSSNVMGRRSAMMSTTGRVKRMESPKSPLLMFTR